MHCNIAVLEGAEEDHSRYDHSGLLYPVNTLRNLAACDNMAHPAPTVFLVDSDFIPSSNLRSELHLSEVQERLAAGAARSVAVVVPALELSEDSKELPLKESQVVIGMWYQGGVQGFHTDYFPMGYEPTDFDRWMMTEEDDHDGALAYSVPYKSYFEPYVVMSKSSVPFYDERFRGYGMNKASLVSLACFPCIQSEGVMGLSSADMHSEGGQPRTQPAYFVVLRRGFVFARPHPKSKD
ncbi:unnamed protein product [Choristocarpus tenellus]